MITIATLRKWGACDEAVAWVKETYPDGVPLSAAKTVRRDWLRWLACYARDAALRDKAWAALKAREDVSCADYLQAACYAPDAALRDKAWAALAAREDATCADYLQAACYAHDAALREKARAKLEAMR